MPRPAHTERSIWTASQGQATEREAAHIDGYASPSAIQNRET
jgi:hypothetical protein